MWFSIITGLSIGFLGSFHCIGMCGPIALSLPIHNKTKAEKALVILLYNLGRSITYAAFGAVLGFISNRFAIVGYQQIVSIVAGALILLFLLLTYVFPNDHSVFGKFHLSVQNALSKALYAKKNNLSCYRIIEWSASLRIGIFGGGYGYHYRQRAKWRFADVCFWAGYFSAHDISVSSRQLHFYECKKKSKKAGSLLHWFYGCIAYFERHELRYSLRKPGFE